MAQRIGTVVIAPMRINDDTIQYPIVYSSEIEGGAQSGPDLASRNAVALHHRRWGMTFRIYNDSTNNGNWVLTYGLNSLDMSDNLNWKLDQATAVNLNVKKIDLSVNGSGSLLLPANTMLFSILINAQGPIALFKAGYTSAADDLVMGQPLDSGFTNFIKGIFFPAPTTIYFSGVSPASVVSLVTFQF